MKQSHYAICRQLSTGDFALYSMTTGRFALCDGNYAKAFFSLTGNDSELKDLKDAGFLVDESRDEISEQQEIFEQARENRSRLFLSIAPTYACNCRCAYCYEQDKMAAKSLMNSDVEKAIYDLVAQRFAKDHFNSLFVEWYGGDPQLCLDIVARISDWMIAFCEENSIVYDSMMLSNSSRIGAHEARLIADAHVSSMLITIDGPKDIHNARRRAIDVEDTYGAIMSAIGHLQDNGIYVNAAMNADKVNMEHYAELRSELNAIGVELTAAKLNDYAHTFNKKGEAIFCQPNFDLYTHEEFAHAGYEQMVIDGFTPAKIKGLLAPCDHFCSGQLNASYVIDAFGDVYKCDGWMGDKEHAIFNLIDGSAPVHDAITFNPFEDEKCRQCELLPVCMGNCSWERELSGWPCHPLKHTLDDYLESYASCFSKRTDPFEVLA